jgi:DNA-binding NarL/FixJ family response regulator
VIADDSVLLREGLARLLAEAGIETVALAGDADALIAAVAEHEPELALVDIRMPPGYRHEGAQAALEIRERWPHVGILLLSQSMERQYAMQLAQAHPRALGYLLKERLADVTVLIDAVERVAAGGTVLDPEVVSHFLGRHTAPDRLRTLSGREREVLTLMTEGRSNRALAKALQVNEKTVETHISSIFTKLGLLPEPDDHRRVLAVRAWLDQ